MVSPVDTFLAGLSTERELRACFTTVCPPYTIELCVKSVQEANCLLIACRILDAANTRIGQLERRLYRENNRPIQIVHQFSSIDPAHQRRGILRSTLRAQFPYYYNLGASDIELNAKREGPIVWPKFGFDFTMDSAEIRHELADVSKDDITATPELARDYIYFTKPGLGKVGEIAIQRVQEKVIVRCRNPDATMGMSLDLRDGPTREWLRQQGLL